MSGLDPRRNAFRSDLAAASLRGHVDSTRYVDGLEATVVRGVAALRRRPGAGEPMDSEAVFGDRVSVFEEVTTTDGSRWSWCQMQRDGYVGYMENGALSDLIEEPTHRVCVPRTLMFPDADLKRPPVDRLPLGARVRVAAVVERNGTSYATLASGEAVPAEHLCDIDETAPDYVDVALRLVDTPYLWGGSTPFGIDCSGLVQLAMAEAGLAAPRDSDMQEAEIGEPLDVDPHAPVVERGDLVFWPGHVGIMTNGTDMLHANAHHMRTALEPLAATIARLEGRGIVMTSARRPGPASNVDD